MSQRVKERLEKIGITELFPVQIKTFQVDLTDHSQVDNAGNPAPHTLCVRCRVTSLARKRSPLGPYRRPLPTVLWS